MSPMYRKLDILLVMVAHLPGAVCSQALRAPLRGRGGGGQLPKGQGLHCSQTSPSAAAQHARSSPGLAFLAALSSLLSSPRGRGGTRSGSACHNNFQPAADFPSAPGYPPPSVSSSARSHGHTGRLPFPAPAPTVLTLHVHAYSVLEVEVLPRQASP